MKIGIIGSSGRMGRELVMEIASRTECSLSGAVEKPSSPFLGKDAGIVAGIDSLGVTVTDDYEALFAEADAVIDFTSPENTLACAERAVRHHTAHIIGTTGFTEEQRRKLEQFAEKTPIVLSSNMSVGVNLLFQLVEKAAQLLGDDYDIEIVEMHHKHKVDAPSGTALSLGHAAAKGRNIDFSSHATLSREGITGPREKGTIGFATLRGGDVIGDHTVMFAGEGERIEITHKSSNRKIYAKGAVRAALWAAGKAKEQAPEQAPRQALRLYSMHDVLNT